jgi:hypothetical protein
MEKIKPLTEGDILLENLRICRMILEFKPGDGLLEQCRNALRENIKQYDRLQLKRQEQARERKAKKSGGG